MANTHGSGGSTHPVWPPRRSVMATTHGSGSCTHPVWPPRRSVMANTHGSGGRTHPLWPRLRVAAAKHPRVRQPHPPSLATSSRGHGQPPTGPAAAPTPFGHVLAWPRPTTRGSGSRTHPLWPRPRAVAANHLRVRRPHPPTLAATSLRNDQPAAGGTLEARSVMPSSTSRPGGACASVRLPRRRLTWFSDRGRRYGARASRRGAPTSLRAGSGAGRAARVRDAGRSGGPARESPCRRPRNRR
jgi:hypothetical protein